MSAAPQAKPHLKFRIEMTKGPHAGATYNFEKETVSIGRGPENDIILSNDLRVSRQHAEIKLNATEHFVLNLSQKNFVLVNGQRVQTEKLEAGSLVQVGESELKFTPEYVPVKPVVAATAPLTQNNVTPLRATTGSFNSAVSVPPAMASSLPQQRVATSAATAATPGPLGYPTSPLPPLGGANTSTPFGAAQNRGVASGGGNSRVKFYGIIAVVGLALWFFLSGEGKKGAKDPNAIRTSDQIASDLQSADKLIEQLEKRKRQLSEVQYARAQENFIKAFRDFQQGQYGRAREAFQVVLNLDPDNDLAKRYLQLSKIKFDEMVKRSMIQGSRYREKKNWRLCQSSFFNVMTMLQNRKDDPTYLEAKRYYDECALNTEGRY